MYRVPREGHEILSGTMPHAVGLGFSGCGQFSDLLLKFRNNKKKNQIGLIAIFVLRLLAPWGTSSLGRLAPGGGLVGVLT